MSVVSFENLFFQDTFYTRNAHLGTIMIELIKPSCQAKAGAHSQGARFLKIDLAQLSSQKRFGLRNS